MRPELRRVLRHHVGVRVRGIARHVHNQIEDTERLLEDLDMNPREVVTAPELLAIKDALEALRTAEGVLTNPHMTELREAQP